MLEKRDRIKIFDWVYRFKKTKNSKHGTINKSYLKKITKSIIIHSNRIFFDNAADPANFPILQANLNPMRVK